MIIEYKAVFHVSLILQFIGSSFGQWEEVQKYLHRYGYLDDICCVSGELNTGTVEALKKFQDFNGLKVTGEYDEVTKFEMKKPRCGNKDKKSKNPEIIVPWSRRNLTYKITKYHSGLNNFVVDREVKKAFRTWEAVTPLRFYQTSYGYPDIEIKFVRGNHGDGYPFEGPGGEIAHAFMPNGGGVAHAFKPNYEGDAHFDYDEIWTLDSYDGCDLFQTLTHEFGHSLGLEHSPNRRSVMHSSEPRFYDPNFELHDEDIKAIQTLYPNDPDSFTPDDMLCSMDKIDTIFDFFNNDTYMFKGEYYWRFTEESVALGYPKKISSTWPGLPSDIDAAFTVKDFENNKTPTYFFKGNRYWKYDNYSLAKDDNYPQYISKGFPGVPDNLDAAMIYPSGLAFFFKGSQVWTRDHPSQYRYHSIPINSKWRGLPRDLDGAVARLNGYMYFFKGNDYYRIYYKSDGIDREIPPYPRPVNQFWFGCKFDSNRKCDKDSSRQDDSDSSCIPACCPTYFNCC